MVATTEPEPRFVSEGHALVMGQIMSVLDLNARRGEWTMRPQYDDQGNYLNYVHLWSKLVPSKVFRITVEVVADDDSGPGDDPVDSVDDSITRGEHRAVEATVAAVRARGRSTGPWVD